MSTILVTGGTGCIGASTVQHLLASDPQRIIVTSRRADASRIAMWQETGAADIDPRIELVTLDLVNDSDTRELLERAQPTHIVHLAALQSPACDADPAMGMQINVGGVMNLLEAADPQRLQRFVFASSAAVYGKRAMYRRPTIAESSQLAPPNLYGIWKMASEQLARLFHERTGIPTVCLRLNTTYGPGRDLGKTAAPTCALKAIARGAASGHVEAYAMPYEGRENYHYVEDVGCHFAACASQPFAGYAALNIKGQTVEVSEFLALAQIVATRLGMGEFCKLSIAEGAEENLFVCDLADEEIDRHFPNLPRTALEDGIERSLARFGELAKRGALA